MLTGLKEKTSEIVKKKTKHKDGLSPWEEYLEKKKEKHKKKREQKSAKSVGSALCVMCFLIVPISLVLL